MHRLQPKTRSILRRGRHYLLAGAPEVRNRASSVLLRLAACGLCAWLLAGQWGTVIAADPPAADVPATPTDVWPQLSQPGGRGGQPMKRPPGLRLPGYPVQPASWESEPLKFGPAQLPAGAGVSAGLRQPRNVSASAESSQSAGDADPKDTEADTQSLPLVPRREPGPAAPQPTTPLRMPGAVDTERGPPAGSAAASGFVTPAAAVAAFEGFGSNSDTEPDTGSGNKRSELLRLPGTMAKGPASPDFRFDDPPYQLLPIEPPLGFTGRSGILPREPQQSSHFVPLEDRWRSGFPQWDRYGRGHPPVDDYPYQEGRILNPYTQNELKGDYPILGQHTFLNITATDVMLLETRQVPTEANSLETSSNPNQGNVFGNPNQFFFNNNTSVSLDLSHGDAAFKPTDWRIRVTPVFNENDTQVHELGVLTPDVRDGTNRYRTFTALQEWFAETKIADLSPDYDFASVRVGSQQFASDFRSFIFNDTNRAIRLFGTRLANRDQFNLAIFDQAEKDTNSNLNTFKNRGQDVLIMNYYRQDFIWPGYTTQFSFHYDHDQATTHYDDNGFLVRPDPAGVFQPHQVNAYYLGWAGDGHINRLNISHAFYEVLGRDSLNPLAGQPQKINAQMAACELSYDRDWVRFRTSFFYASGDHNVNGHTATGFDSIFDSPNFAGGQFSFWQRQAIKLNGVNLVQRFSLIPDLRSSKTEGQANFVNPGLELFNVGIDFDLTPKLRLVNNCNLLGFDSTNVLQQFLFQNKIHRFIGTDLSMGVEYRPLLSNNIIFNGGISALVPGQGFHDIYDPIAGRVGTLFASFMEMTLTY
jgi:hypothetical protein